MSRHPYKESGQKYEIEAIQDWHREILRLAVLGYRQKDVIQITGYSEAHVSTIWRSKVFQEQLEILQSARDADTIQVTKRILGMAPLALERINEVLSAPIMIHDVDPETGNETVKVDTRIPPALKVSTAQDMLDRGGYAKIEKKIIGHMTAEQMQKYQQDAIQAGIEDGVIIDGDENAEASEVISANETSQNEEDPSSDTDRNGFDLSDDLSESESDMSKLG